MYRVLIFIVWSLLFSNQLFAQRTIVGKVTDCKGELLYGATIMIKGTNIGTSADENGYYRIELPKEFDTRKQALVFEYYGTKTQEVFIKGRDTIDVQLKYYYVPARNYYASDRVRFTYTRPPEPSAPGAVPRRIVGRITDLKGVSLHGATIQVKGTDLRVTANRAGYYSIELPENLKQRKLTFIFSHSETKTETVEIKGKYKNRVNVTLEYIIPYNTKNPCE